MRLSLILAFIACSAAHSGSIQLDMLFARNGKLIMGFGGTRNNVFRVVRQPDDKVLVIGAALIDDERKYDFGIVRLDSRGRPDQSFGNGGRVLTDFFGRSDSAVAGTVMSDGRIVVVGTSDDGLFGHTQLAMARYLPDGSLDSSFGQNGRVLQKFSAEYRPFAVLPEKIDASQSGLLILGENDYRGNSRSMLTRFGVDGTVSGESTLLEEETRYTSLIRLRNGKLLLLGKRSRPNASYGSVLIVKRLYPDGSLDHEFGDKGMTAELHPNSTETGARNAIELADGSIVLAGYVGQTSVNHPALIALDVRGKLLPSFGNGGRAVDFSGMYHGGYQSLGLASDRFILTQGILFRQTGTQEIAPSETSLSLYSLRGDHMETFTTGSGATTVGSTDIPHGGVILPEGRYFSAMDIYDSDDNRRFGCVQFFTGLP